jgi:hypothetical protein
MPLLLLLGLLVAVPQARTDLADAIASLGNFDFDIRTNAARTVRRAPPATVVPALEEAARKHPDEYVRFRALVILSGLDTAATTRVASDLMGDRNDRLRAVAYQWFERHPRADVLPRLLAALPREDSPYVRPALTRALAAYPNDPRAQEVLRPLVLRGEDQFRSSVITALGEYGGVFALKEITAVAETDGPLRDDAIMALGRIGDPGSRVFVAGLQKTGAPDQQPTVSAALCLLKIDCPARLKYVIDTTRFAIASPDQQPLLRSGAQALAMLALAGHEGAFPALVDAALASVSSARDELTLTVGTVILRRPALALIAFEERKQDKTLGELYRDSFDMLSEDFEEEAFGAEIRRALYAAPAGSPRRQAAQALLEILEF